MFQWLKKLFGFGRKTTEEFADTLAESKGLPEPQSWPRVPRVYDPHRHTNGVITRAPARPQVTPDHKKPPAVTEIRRYRDETDWKKTQEQHAERERQIRLDEDMRRRQLAASEDTFGIVPAPDFMSGAILSTISTMPFHPAELVEAQNCPAPVPEVWRASEAAVSCPAPQPYEPPAPIPYESPYAAPSPAPYAAPSPAPYAAPSPAPYEAPSPSPSNDSFTSSWND